MGDTVIRLTKAELDKAENTVKRRFLPREGSVFRTGNGMLYRVAFVNVGQLRFTAVFDGVVGELQEPTRGMAEPGEEEGPTTA